LSFTRRTFWRQAADVLGNLRRHPRLFGYESPGVFGRRLELGRGGPKAVRADVKHINGQDMKSLVEMFFKPAAQQRPPRDILLGYFFLPEAATLDDVVWLSAVCVAGFGKDDGAKLERIGTYGELGSDPHPPPHWVRYRHKHDGVYNGRRRSAR
jgi:hypothetical protein